MRRSRVQRCREQRPGRARTPSAPPTAASDSGEESFSFRQSASTKLQASAPARLSAALPCHAGAARAHAQACSCPGRAFGRTGFFGRTWSWTAAPGTTGRPGMGRAGSPSPRTPAAGRARQLSVRRRERREGERGEKEREREGERERRREKGREEEREGEREKVADDGQRVRSEARREGPGTRRAAERRAAGAGRGLGRAWHAPLSSAVPIRFATSSTLEPFK